MNQFNPTPSEGPVRSTLSPTKQSLSVDQQRLVKLFQRVRYGRIRRLWVQGGQPVMAPDLR